MCGWEVDDVVAWLDDFEGMFDSLTGVSRSTDFDAWLSFGGEADAARLRATLEDGEVPAAMRSALEEITVDGKRVRLRFTPVDEVPLTIRGDGHVAACVHS